MKKSSDYGYDGTAEKPVRLPCPDHAISAVVRELTPYLNPAVAFICSSHDHLGERRWGLCNGGWHDGTGGHHLL